MDLLWISWKHGFSELSTKNRGVISQTKLDRCNFYKGTPLTHLEPRCFPPTLCSLWDRNKTTALLFQRQRALSDTLSQERITAGERRWSALSPLHHRLRLKQEEGGELSGKAASQTSQQRKLNKRSVLKIYLESLDFKYGVFLHK